MPTTASIYRPLIAVLALFATLSAVIGVHAQPAGALPAGVSGEAWFRSSGSATVQVDVSPDESLGSRLDVFVADLFGNGVSCTGETGTLGVTTDPPGTTEFTADPLLRSGHLPRTTLPCVANSADDLIGSGGVYIVVIEVRWRENGPLQTHTVLPAMTRQQVATLVTFDVLHPDGIRSVRPPVPVMTDIARLRTFVTVPQVPVPV